MDKTTANSSDCSTPMGAMKSLGADPFARLTNCSRCWKILNASEKKINLWSLRRRVTGKVLYVCILKRGKNLRS